MARKLLYFTLLFILILFLGACASKEENHNQDIDTESTSKIVLMCGTIVLDPAIEKEIVRFNKLNNIYEIQIKDYLTEARGDEKDAIMQLNFDVINNNGPDILILPIYYSMDLYAEKEILEDLYPYIDNDSELSREDFLPNIVNAYERDDKLYGLPVCFDIDTMIGPTSVLGKKTNWTLDEMIEFVSKYDMEVDFFENSSQTSVMKICVKANWNRFVNWQGDSFSFDRELYKQILEFTSRFPKDQEYVHNRKYQERILEKNLYLLDSSASVYHVSQDQLYSSLFQEPVTYIGYPTNDGKGSLIWSATTFSINSQSNNKEGAWEFIRILLSKEYYERASFVRGFSIRKDVFESQLQEGNDGFVGLMIGEDFNPTDVKTVSKDEIERIRQLVMSAGKIESYDYEIIGIILEESEAYFQGYKSADEVADIVENRIRIYISELM